MLTNTHSVSNHRVDLFSMLAVAEGFGTPGRPGLPYFARRKRCQEPLFAIGARRQGQVF